MDPFPYYIGTVDLPLIKSYLNKPNQCISCIRESCAQKLYQTRIEFLNGVWGFVDYCWVIELKEGWDIVGLVGGDSEQ